MSSTKSHCDNSNSSSSIDAMYSSHSDDISKSDECAPFYEGTEKTLEVWFTGSGLTSSGTGLERQSPNLRKIHYKDWEELLKYARCEILSFRRTEHLDGFVLSESSMFVYKDHVIIKTCGQTTLLNTLEPLLYLAKTIAGFDEILDVFYSRKKFMRPELQDKMHSSFDNEIEILDSELSAELGSAYCMGRMNRECWYLYTLAANNNNVVSCADQTLELIMIDLDEEIMSVFTRSFSKSARDATQKSGIDKLFNNMQIDDFLFKPCGYSMNGFLRSGHYVTIHVTPEMEFSYVSFETNAPLASYTELINKVLRIFKPGKFIMTMFANEMSEAFSNNSASAKQSEFKSLKKGQSMAGYMPEEIQLNRFKNYELTFGNYSREAG